ncbi:TPA: hypothetical protein ACGOOA_000984, partial [Streptococcus pyogenes]
MVLTLSLKLPLAMLNGDHSRQHSSKTDDYYTDKSDEFWDHSKQHSSKTQDRTGNAIITFWDHSKQHSSKTVG